VRCIAQLDYLPLSGPAFCLKLRSVAKRSGAKADTVSLDAPVSRGRGEASREVELSGDDPRGGDLLSSIFAPVSGSRRIAPW